MRIFIVLALMFSLIGCSSEDSATANLDYPEIQLSEKEQYFVNEYGYEPAYVVELYRKPDCEVRKIARAFINSDPG